MTAGALSSEAAPGPGPGRTASPSHDLPASPISVVVTCMGRLEHLQASLPLLAEQPELRTLLVDYGCPEQCGKWAEEHFPQVTVERAGPQRHFNVSRARNLGATAADTPWICFVDADTLVDPGFAARLLQHREPHTFYLADPCPHELSGLVLCSTEDFHAAGGYDELFEGWGSEDKDLYLRLQRMGCRRATFPAHTIRSIAHDDAARTRYHAVQDRFLSLRVHGMYLQIKTDLALLIGKPEHAFADREELYRRIRQRVLDDPAAVAQMDVRLPQALAFTAPPGWRLRRTLQYRFEPEDFHDR